MSYMGFGQRTLRNAAVVGGDEITLKWGGSSDPEVGQVVELDIENATANPLSTKLPISQNIDPANDTYVKGLGLVLAYDKNLGQVSVLRLLPGRVYQIRKSLLEADTTAGPYVRADISKTKLLYSNNNSDDAAAPNTTATGIGHFLTDPQVANDSELIEFIITKV